MIVDIKGVGQAQFPDDMAIADIRSFLRNKYYDRAAQGQSDILSPQPQTASPYELTLTERLGGGIAEGLKGAGLISDNYGAQQIGKNVTALGEFLPGIGDASAGDDFGRAVAEGDNLGMGLAALGAIPVVGDAARRGARAFDDLPMDEFSRMKRGHEQGFKVKDDMFHGTTHDFNEFSDTGADSNLNKEGHWGAGHYFTNKSGDASDNYAGIGPDLENRINQRSEQIANEMDWDYDDPRAIEQATKELVGHEGAILPVKLREGKVFDLRGRSESKLGYERETPDWEDYLDDAEGDEDIARELAEEASWDEEPTGEVADFIESLQRQADEYGFDADEIIGEIQQQAVDYEGISASALDNIMRKTEWWAEDPETGALINNEVYRQAVEDAGFDSIKHSAVEDFPSMKMPIGTEHTIIFKPENVRSKFAKFDPKNKQKAGLLGGLGALGLGTGISSQQSSKEESY